MDIDTVAGELYALPRDEFTPARNARAGEVSDGELAAAIRKLRKPTVAAWLADAVAREHPREVAELAEIGQALREAQQQLAGTTLRELASRRQEVVRQLLRLAVQTGKQHGQPVGEATARQLEDTFTAATTDAAVAEALREARLDRQAEPGTVAWPEPGTVDISPTQAPRRGKRQRKPKAAPQPEPERRPDRREREWARHVARRAQRALQDAERDADSKAREQRRAEAAVDDLRERLDSARRDAREAARAARQAAGHRDAAAREAEAAERRLRDLER